MSKYQQDKSFFFFGGGGGERREEILCPLVERSQLVFCLFVFLVESPEGHVEDEPGEGGEDDEGVVDVGDHHLILMDQGKASGICQLKIY